MVELNYVEFKFELIQVKLNKVKLKYKFKFNELLQNYVRV